MVQHTSSVACSRRTKLQLLPAVIVCLAMHLTSYQA